MLASLPANEAPAVPVLPEHLDFVLRAWERLQHDRPWIGGGMGPTSPGRIPWRLVIDWARFHNYSHDMIALLDAGIFALDTEYLEWMASQRAAGASQGATHERKLSPVH